MIIQFSEKALIRHYSAVHDRLWGPQKRMRAMPAPKVITGYPTRHLEGALRRTWKAIVFEVCAKHGVTFVNLISARRTTAITIARQEAMYRLSAETTLTLPHIGAVLNRDRSSVEYGIAQHCERMEITGRQLQVAAVPADPVAPTWKSILLDVSRRHEVPIEEILSKASRRRVVFARQEAMHLFRSELGMSLPEIGHYLDRDHTTVLYGIRQFVARRKRLAATL
jgi:chromosomal replication initiation ATPase DnaA